MSKTILSVLLSIAYASSVPLLAQSTPMVPIDVYIPMIVHQVEPVVQATPSPQSEVCLCDKNRYNCSRLDFETKEDAQACYDYCFEIVSWDVHDLNRDEDVDDEACDLGLTDSDATTQLPSWIIETTK